MLKSETNSMVEKRKEVGASEAKYSKRNMVKDEVRGRKGLYCIVPCNLGFYSKCNRKPLGILF